MDNILFGKYISKDTIIHRIDPRLKFFALISLMVACFLPYGSSSVVNGDGTVEYFGYYANQFLVLGALAVFIFIIMIIAKVSFVSFFKSLKAIWFMMVFLLIFMVFIPQTSNTVTLHPIISFANGYTIYRDGVLQCAHVLLRIVLMLALTLILTSTTSPMDITFTLEWYLTPLRLVKFPTQIISMMISLTLRFIPSLFEYSQRIMKAQKSRGVDYDKGFLKAKIKSITTLIVPLLVSCFTISDDLTFAMDARGYDPYSKRTRYKILSFHLVDFVSVIVVLLVFSIFIALCVMAQHYKINFWEVFGISGTW